jgi:CRAL/TRIO domain
MATTRSMTTTGDRHPVNPGVVVATSLFTGQFVIVESSPLHSGTCSNELTHRSIRSESSTKSRSSRRDPFKIAQHRVKKQSALSSSVSFYEKSSPLSSMFQKKNNVATAKKKTRISSTKSLIAKSSTTTQTTWDDHVKEDEKLPAVVEFDTCSSNTDESTMLESTPSPKVKKRTSTGSVGVGSSSRKNGSNRNSSDCTISDAKNRRGSTRFVLDSIVYQKPDFYGQSHPIETDELIEAALEEFEHELRKMSSEISCPAVMAEQMCPEIVSRDFKLCFLRTEVFRVSDALSRYTIYWSKRLQLFGPTRAFKPITLSFLTESEREILSSQFVSILPSLSTTAVDEYGNETVDPRAILFIQFAKFERATMCNEDIVRVMWYMIHSLINDINCQKRGFVFLENAANFHAIKNCPPLDFLRMSLSYVQGCIPLRLSGNHIVNPNNLLKMVFPVVSMMLSERLRKRVIVHTDRSIEQVISKLSNRYKIDRSRLPTQIGGTYQLNCQQWMQQQINDGK